MSENENNQYRLLSPWAYVDYGILFMLPVIGWILAIVFALNDDNLNRRNFARGYWCGVLVVVIVGGLDSVLGALVGGILIGLIEALAGAYLGGEYKLLATFIVLVAVLLVRPYGLFGTHEIERL